MELRKRKKGEIIFNKQDKNKTNEQGHKEDKELKIKQWLDNLPFESVNLLIDRKNRKSWCDKKNKLLQF